MSSYEIFEGHDGNLIFSEGSIMNCITIVFVLGITAWAVVLERKRRKSEGEKDEREIR